MKSKKCIRAFIKKYSSNIKRDFRSKYRYFDFIFLCGKKLDNCNDNRSIISQALSYDQKFCFYAENFNNELPNKYDLLTKEIIYQDICIAVVIIVESMGSACELGAFTYYNNNAKKVWVINDINFKCDDSFIEKGPISKIKNFDSRHVIYVKKNSNGLIDLSSENANDLKRINKTSSLKKNVIIDHKDKNYVEINDLKLLVYYIFDYLIVFKCLIIKKFYLDLKAILKKREIILCLSDKTKIKCKEDICLIIKNILSIMQQAGLIFKSFNKNVEYYGLNNSLAYSKFNSNKLPHVIFKNDLYSNHDFEHDLSVIYNLLKKEGFILWKKK